MSNRTKNLGVYSPNALDLSESDIEGDEEFDLDNNDMDLSFSTINDGETDREGMSLATDNANSDFDFESQGSLHLSDLEGPNNLSEQNNNDGNLTDTTYETDISLGGRYKRKSTRRKHSKRKITRRKHSKRKSTRRKHSKKKTLKRRKH
jgi:hypothetical protein